MGDIFRKYEQVESSLLTHAFLLVDSKRINIDASGGLLRSFYGLFCC